MLEEFADNVLIHSCALARLRCFLRVVVVADPLGWNQTRLVAIAQLGELLV